MKVTLGFSSLGLLEKVIFLSFFLFFSYLVRAFEWIDCVLASELRQYETWTLFSFLKIIRQLVKGAWVSAYQSKWRKMNKNSTRASQDYLSLHSLSHHSHWGEKITNPSSCLHFLIFLFFFISVHPNKGTEWFVGRLGRSNMDYLLNLFNLKNIGLDTRSGLTRKVVNFVIIYPKGYLRLYERKCWSKLWYFSSSKTRSSPEFLSIFENQSIIYYPNVYGCYMLGL